MLQEQTYPPRNHWLGEPVDEIDMPLEGHLALTEYGTRMSLRVILPDKLALHAPDGHRMH